MNIIKSVQLNDNVVTIVTKSNITRVYKLKSNEIAQMYFNDLNK